MREAFYGTTRFDEFERHLGIAPNILSARLRDLTEHGLLEKAPLAEGGARQAYRLTEKGNATSSPPISHSRPGPTAG